MLQGSLQTGKICRISFRYSRGVEMQKANFFEFRSGYSYEQALRYQSLLNQEGYTGLLAFEAEETITLGRGAQQIEEELLVSSSFLKERGTKLLSTDRGGKATWHGPGQLVGFPIADLRRIYGDIRAVKRFSEELLLGLAHACASLGVKSVETRSDFPGIWTRRGKLASIGFTVKDGIVFHGFSLNLTSECMAGFSLINPCGIANCQITSLEQEGVRVESVNDLALKILPYLTVISGSEVLQSSKTVRYESTYADLVATISRSQMAIDHFRTNLEGFRNGE